MLSLCDHLQNLMCTRQHELCSEEPETVSALLPRPTYIILALLLYAPTRLQYNDRRNRQLLARRKLLCYLCTVHVESTAQIGRALHQHMLVLRKRAHERITAISVGGVAGDGRFSALQNCRCVTVCPAVAYRTKRETYGGVSEAFVGGVTHTSGWCFGLAWSEFCSAIIVVKRPFIQNHDIG